ncbi:hypothetical protein [Granulicella sp. S190]|uniref:hypothetical protein n=1 Tax=Granulicella sp. S190 TaxID=1747226 RepID=UPI00131B78AE|nr:hypothetical protein [Granulicella sp. S190]
MRSELVFNALTYESNRYRLVKLLAKATRRMHRPNTRLQETTNCVLSRFQVLSASDETGRIASEWVRHRRAA